MEWIENVMKTFGQEILDKYNLRKAAVMNMGNELQEQNGRPNNFSSDLEKTIYIYNTNLEAANEKIVEKGKIVHSNSRVKRIIKRAAGKILYVFLGNLLSAVNYFQEKVINVLVSNRDMLIYQNNRVERVNEKAEEYNVQVSSRLEKIEEYNVQVSNRFEKIEECNAKLTDKIDKLYLLNNTIDQNINNEDHCEIVLKKFRMNQEADGQKLASAFCDRMEKFIDEKEHIVIFCAGLHKYGDIEAIRNEAYATFDVLRKNNRFNVTLISLEHRDVIVQENVIYATRERIAATIDKIKPSLILILESLPLVALDFEGVFYHYKTIVKITSQDPLQSLETEQIDELRHANDFGVFHFIVESDYAKQVMLANGFFHVKVMRPIIDFSRICVHKTINAKIEFVVGYASAPVTDEQMADKGVFLLEKLMAMLPDVQFQVLWRTEDLQIPMGLKEAHNISVIYGQTDMKEFYQGIDILIIPYTSADNHACPLSGVEAVLSHVPIICTELSGAVEIIQRYAAGIVCKADAADLCRSISKMASNYADFFQHMLINQARKDFIENELESYISELRQVYFPDEFITIEHWASIMLQSGRYLAKGYHNIKKYYQDQEIAQSYHTNRFIQYPGNCYDIMERSSVNVIMGQVFKNRKDDLLIMDIACGDGRIVQEDLRWGKCIAIDSSTSMLEVVRQRFKNEKNLELRQCDFFEDDIDQKFDVITVFRYIRHYNGAQRRKLYYKIKNCLKEDGILIFDVCNIRYSMEDRRKAGWEGFHIYDVFWTETSIKEELIECGFHINYLLPVEIKDLHQGPVTWTVAAQPDKEVLKCT